VCSHSTSMLQGNVSHQTENESVAIQLGDGMAVSHEADKPSDDHYGHSRNGRVSVLVSLVIFLLKSRYVGIVF